MSGWLGGRLWVRRVLMLVLVAGAGWLAQPAFGAYSDVVLADARGRTGV